MCITIFKLYSKNKTADGLVMCTKKYTQKYLENKFKNTNIYKFVDTYLWDVDGWEEYLYMGGYSKKYIKKYKQQCTTLFNKQKQSGMDYFIYISKKGEWGWVVLSQQEKQNFVQKNKVQFVPMY